MTSPRPIRRSTTVRFSPVLVAVALSPAFLQVQYDCANGDTTLASLELEVSGVDQIDAFAPAVKQYTATVSSDTVVLRAQPTDPAASVFYQLRQGGALLTAGALGVGGGEVTLSLPVVGAFDLKVDVRPPQGGFGFYEVDIVRLPKFDCSEQGIIDAIAIGGGPHTFDCEGPTVVLTQAEIVIDNDVILDGEGNLTIDGNSDHRVLFVDGATVELVGFTVRGGFVDANSDFGQIGGGILNFGALTLTNSTASGNTADGGGGAIYSNNSLTLANSVLSDNTAGAGGGLFVVGGEVTLINSTVSGNTGSGIFTLTVVTLLNSTVSGNTGTEGGGIHGSVTLINSTVSANTAATGGGLYTDGTLINSTVSGNTAVTEGGGLYGGGTLINSTVSGNTASRGSDLRAQGDLVLTNSVVVGDCYAQSPFEIFSAGGNIESPGDTCGLTDPTDLANVTEAELNLGPLQDNGGPTMTHALLPGSVAIDHIPAVDCVDAEGAPLTTDQRGEPRPETGGTMCDVGAFEVQP